MVRESYKSISWKFKIVNITSDYVRLTPQCEIRKFVDLDWQKASDEVKKSISKDFELSVIGNDILIICLIGDRYWRHTLAINTSKDKYLKVSNSCWFHLLSINVNIHLKGLIENQFFNVEEFLRRLSKIISKIESKRTSYGLIELWDNTFIDIWPLSIDKPDLGGLDGEKG